MDAGQGGDMRLQARAEGRSGNARRAARPAPPAAAGRAQQAVAAMLCDQRGDRRQLPHLVGERLTEPLLRAVEGVPALT